MQRASLIYRIHRYTATPEHPEYFTTEYWRGGKWNAHGGRFAIKWATGRDAFVSLVPRVGTEANLMLYLDKQATN